MELNSDRPRARRLAFLAMFLLAARLLVFNHPIPVHPDEAEFIAALGFPAVYPVHHPGYPLWVAIGSLAWWAGLSPYVAFQCWSVLASIAGPLLAYAMLRRTVDDRLAWWTAFAMGVCPIMWFTGVSALSYSTAAALSMLIICLCWQALEQRRKDLLFFAMLALTIGFFLRPDLVVWLGMVVALVAWRLRGPAVFLIGIALILITCAGAFVTAELLYERAPAGAPMPEVRHTWQVVLGTSVFRLGIWHGLVRNSVKLAVNLAWNLWPLAVAVFGVLIWSRKTLHHPATASRTLATIMCFWVIPPLAFMTLIHMTEPTHVSLFLPAAYIAFALFLDRHCTPALALRIACVVAISMASQFLFYPWSAQSAGIKRVLDAKIGFVSASGIRHIDHRNEIHSPGDFWPTAAHEASEKK